MEIDHRHRLLMAAIEALNEDQALDQVRALLSAGENPLRIIESSQSGMRLVGERYHRGDYYIAGLIMAGEIFRQLVEIVKPGLSQRISAESAGTLLLGTVEGDIHDLGKDIFKILIECYGFQVIDLGVDVPVADFLSQAILVRPHIIGISALLTGDFDNLKKTVAVLKADQTIRTEKIPIIIGGAQLNQKVCEDVGADYWTNDAAEGVRICRKLVGAVG
jgi:methanogenic corrinoid protein MtbC1